MSSPSDLLKNALRGLKMIGPTRTLQAGLYPLRKAFHVARFDEDAGTSRGLLPTLAKTLHLAYRSERPQPPPAEAFAFIGEVLDHQLHGPALELTCQSGSLRITFVHDTVVQVRYRTDNEWPEPFSYAVEQLPSGWEKPTVTLLETEEALELCTTRMSCRVQKSDGRLSFRAPDGFTISADSLGVGACGEWVGCWRRLDQGEHIYGLGEKAGPLDHCGRRYEMWATDPQTYSSGDDPLYMSFPLFLGLKAGRSYGLFVDNSYRSVFDVGSEDPSQLVFLAEGGELRYYFIFGPSVDEVLEHYSTLTGRMPLPPLWALGYHQSRWSYYPDSRVREIAAEFRSRRIPCDAIHLDIHYMDGYRNFTWDRRRFPNPAGLIADLRDQGFKVVTLIDAGVKADPFYDTCASGLRHDVFLKYPDGRLFRGPVWPGDCYFPDFTDPRVREWWSGQYARLVEDGIAGTWNDMNEPVIMGLAGDCPPDPVQHSLEGRGATHKEAHNLYGMQMARATYEGLRRLQPACRPFVLTRSAFSGAQRYAAGWTGDNESTWESLALSIPMLLNLGLSGFPFVGADTGGFEGTADGEMLVRWTQLSLFSPLFRNHTALLSENQEPWAAGEPYTSINRRSIELRYQLLPAIYTAFWQSSRSGRPIMRPVFMDWPDDEQTHTLQDQFLFGDHLLVAPILQPSCTERKVYLPDGAWFNWWEDQGLTGPAEITVTAPLERIPFFVRAGAVIPMTPLQQFVGEGQPGRLHLHVFPGQAESHLYEDAGDDCHHLHGSYRHSVFRASREGQTLTVERETEGSFVPEYREYHVHVHGLTGEPAAISIDGVPARFAFGGVPRTAMFVICGEFESIVIRTESEAKMGAGPREKSEP